MKSAALILLFTAYVIFHPSPAQTEKTGTLTLTRADAEILYQIIDDAEVSGKVRRPLLQKISVMYQATWVAQPLNQPQGTSNKADSTAAKNKKP